MNSEGVAVERGGNCWTFDGTIDSKGYGHIYDRGLKGAAFAHRRFYEAFVGHIPDDMCVCHRCDNPSCVNPKHLFLGSQSDNILDAVNKNRWRDGERSNLSKLTWPKVREIRRRYKGNARYNRGPTQQELAEEYGVSRHGISMIVRHKSWKVDHERNGGCGRRKGGKVIGWVRSYQQYSGNLPTISVQITDWDSFEEIIEAMKVGF